MNERSSRGGGKLCYRSKLRREVSSWRSGYFSFSLPPLCGCWALHRPNLSVLLLEQIERSNERTRIVDRFLSFFSFFLSFHPLLLFSTPPFFPPFLIHGEKSGLVPGWDQLYHRLRCTPLMAVTHSRVAPVYTKLHSWPASVHNYQSPKHAVC